MTDTGRYWIESIDIESLIENYGTPLFVYHWPTLEENIKVMKHAFPGVEICYAVKANSSLEVLKRVLSTGCGAEVVSRGELFLLSRCGWVPQTIVFDSVAPDKTVLERALRMKAIVNADSFAVLKMVGDAARSVGFSRQEYRLGIRINPGAVESKFTELSTSSRSSKFGEEPESIERYFSSGTSPVPDGIHFHPGSQIEDESSLLEGVKTCVELVDQLERKGFEIRYIDFGGGFPVPYHPGEGDDFFHMERYGRRFHSLLDMSDDNMKGEDRVSPRKQREKLSEKVRGTDRLVILEPGRVLAASAGNLLLKVQFTKELYGRKWALVDGGANLLVRAAYIPKWYHEIVPFRNGEPLRQTDRRELWSVGGPGCFGADTIATDRELPPLQRGDILAVQHTGAYCASMMTTYCSFPFPPSVGVDRNGNSRLFQRSGRIEELARYDVC
jgi:diaminopimelate decarboxylase